MKAQVRFTPLTTSKLNESILDFPFNIITHPNCFSRYWPADVFSFQHFVSEDGTNHWHLFFWIEDVAHQTTYIPETHSYIQPCSKQKSIRDFSCLPHWFHCNYYKIIEVIFKTPFCNFNYFIDASNNLRSEEIWTTIATHKVNFSSKMGSLFSCLTLVWLDAWRVLSGISPTCNGQSIFHINFQFISGKK